MKIFDKAIIPLFLVAALLASCNGFISTPAISPTDVMGTSMSTVRTAVAETQGAILTATPFLLPTLSVHTATPIASLTTPPPTSTPLVFTDTFVPMSERIVYYYFVKTAEYPIPEGTVLAVFPLAPTYSDETYTSDTVANLRTALRIVLHDGRNIWISNKLEIVDVTFRNGHADVVLQGEYFGMGGAVLENASMQILMTVFANPSVQTAAVTLNGHTIGNLGVSISTHAKPDDYVYTRVEIETFMAEHAYVAP